MGFCGCGPTQTPPVLDLDEQVTARTGEDNLGFGISASSPLYKASYVGGKTRAVLRLSKAGVNIPPSFAVTVPAYKNALEGLEKETGESIEAWISDSTASVESIREALNSDESYLTERLRDQLSNFVDKTKTYSIRSSANCEDGADSSFAGQFLTLLNVKGDLGEVLRGIKQVWASSFSDEVRPYLNSAGVVPEMGVLVMEQLDSEVSGVVFQANPVSQSKSSWMVNATFGQGEGVVGGTLNIDEYVLNAETKAVLRQNIDKKDAKLVLDTINGGLQRVAIENEGVATGPCLTSDMMNKLVETCEDLFVKFKEQPQDIEFAFANGGKLYILQSRPITTMPFKWEIPDVGFWQLNGHMTSPLTPIYQTAWKYGMSKGTMANSELCGIGFVAVDTTIINGFSYFCMRQPGPRKPPATLPPPFLLRMIMRMTAGKAIKQATSFWKEKKYLTFVNEEWNGIKQKHIERHLELQNKDLKAMSEEELSSYLAEMVEYAKDMYYCHSKYSMYNLGPIGTFVLKGEEFSKNVIPRNDFYDCLLGCSKVSEGLHGEFPEVIDMLLDSPAALEVLEGSSSAENKLSSLPESLSSSTDQDAFNRMLSHINYRLAEGYDICSSTLMEQPAVLLASIETAVKLRRQERDPDYAAKIEVDRKNHIAKVRAKIPEKKLEEFNTYLDEARKLAKLRDERAIYTDLWGMGIVRHAVLEAGNRVNAKFPAIEADLLVDASLEEMQTMLKPAWTGDAALVRELRKRRLYRQTASIRNAPPFLGGVKLTPTRAHFPNEYLARTALSVIMAVDGIFETPDLEAEEVSDGQIGNSSTLDPNVLKGLGSSPGEYTGRVCIIKSASDLSKLQDGDVVVTAYSSSLVNLVLGRCAALVTDFGGGLSHAAICAREANIPCVTGTKAASLKLKDGDTVAVYGKKGLVVKKPAKTGGCACCSGMQIDEKEVDVGAPAEQ